MTPVTSLSELRQTQEILQWESERIQKDLATIQSRIETLEAGRVEHLGKEWQAEQHWLEFVRTGDSVQYLRRA